VAIVALGPFDDASLLTATVALNLTCLAASAALLAVTPGRRGLGPVLWTVAVLLALANPYVLETSLNAMESGLVWLSWSLAIIVLTRLMEGWRGTTAAVAAGAGASVASVRPAPLKTALWPFARALPARRAPANSARASGAAAPRAEGARGQTTIGSLCCRRLNGRVTWSS
jgi:hypothetical protein